MSSSKDIYVHSVTSMQGSLALNRALDLKLYILNILEKDGIGRIVVKKDYLDDDRLEYWIIPLHSMSTLNEQDKVFMNPPVDHRKVIISTNIAESSITVPDVKYVIDFCLTKSLTTDPLTNYTCLALEWASKANCIQRKVIHLLLKQLVLLLKTRINNPNKKMLISFLFNMSLLPEYKFWIDSEPMDLWYEWLLSHLKENINRLDKKLMRMICKIGKLRHPSFVKNLDFTALRLSGIS